MISMEHRSKGLDWRVLTGIIGIYTEIRANMAAELKNERMVKSYVYDK